MPEIRRTSVLRGHTMNNQDLAAALMMDFADSTGLSKQTTMRRYLWTDAFAVCNFLGLYRLTGRRSFLDLALTLIDQVHHVLGRHRIDDSRRGWISGLSEEQGELHPTRGGLRIGKSRNECPQDQQPDPREEWDRDGQYFHYLTKWMHALSRAGLETGETRFQLWATELAVTAQRAFTRELFPDGPKRMIWKLSIDLRRPLVSSMGQHDPLEGLITCLELQSLRSTDTRNDKDLELAIHELTAMCDPDNWVTGDLLGIGGLLMDASRLAQLLFHHSADRRELLLQILKNAEVSFDIVDWSSVLSQPAERRLAFRELGLSIGMHGMESIRSLISRDRELAVIVSRLLRFQFSAEQIQSFWTVSTNRQSRTWTDHLDINTVMLATSLAPEGFL